jgi:hypothetical protein
MRIMAAVQTPSTPSPANSVFLLFLEVQSHMWFTAWDDATRRGRIVNGFKEGDGGKNGMRVRRQRSRGRHRQWAATLLLLLPTVNKLHMW